MSGRERSSTVLALLCVVVFLCLILACWYLPAGILFFHVKHSGVNPVFFSFRDNLSCFGLWWSGLARCTCIHLVQVWILPCYLKIQTLLWNMSPLSIVLFPPCFLISISFFDTPQAYCPLLLSISFWLYLHDLTSTVFLDDQDAALPFLTDRLFSLSISVDDHHLKFRFLPRRKKNRIQFRTE